MDVYILFSDKRSRYYVGQTTDIEDRLKRQNQGRVKSTKYGIPWKLVWKFSVEERFEAVKLELKIKKRGAKRFLEDLRIKGLSSEINEIKRSKDLKIHLGV